MPTLHVQRNIQFRSDLYNKSNRTEWYTAVGAELDKRKLSITVAPGIEIKNSADLVSFMKRYSDDKTGLKTAIPLPAGTTIENYVQDLVQAIDDCVTETSDVNNTRFDFSPQSDFSKLLGLETSSRYGSTTTAFGKARADAVFDIAGVTISKAPAAVDPLHGKPIIDSTTFANMPSYQWARDGVELEQVSGVSGLSKDELLTALRATNSAGRTTFQRLRKPEASEAFTIGYSGVGLDDMKWDSDSHRMREGNKFVTLTIEGGRFEAPEPGQPRELSVGTDKMDDTYYDTAKFDLMDADFTVRGRARWDTDTTIRRLLVQVKSNTEIDDFGNKRNGKVDVRNDGASAEEIKALDNDVRSGKISWNGKSDPLKPLKGVYDALNEKGVLPDIGPHQDVLELQPQVHIRSVRSRYHLNEASLSAVQDFYAKTQAKLPEVLALATAAQPGLTGADKTTVDALIKDGTALQDGSAILKAVEAKLKALDPSMTVNAETVKALMPNATSSRSTPSDALTIEKKKVVAEAIDGAYHAFAEQLDGARRIITGSQDRALEQHPAMFREWARSVDTALVNKNTYDPFLAKYDAIAAKPAAELAADLKAFNAYGDAQLAGGNDDFEDWKPLDEAGFKALRNQLVNEVVRVNQRQLEAAGSTALSLWFDEARQLYVPESRRNTGNFIIDTTDMSEYVKHADWEGIPEDQRTAANVIPADKIFHVSLVNETQIELGLEQPYLKRMDSLEGQIKTDRAGMVMRYFDQSGQPGVDKAKVQTYGAALKAILEGPAGERDAFIEKLNAFAATQKSALAPMDSKTLERLDGPGLFTAENRDKPVRTSPELERQLEGAKFIFGQYIDVQKMVVASKEDRVIDSLRDAGAPRGIEWKQTEDSKGNTALKMVRDSLN